MGVSLNKAETPHSLLSPKKYGIPSKLFPSFPVIGAFASHDSNQHKIEARGADAARSTREIGDRPHLLPHWGQLCYRELFHDAMEPGVMDELRLAANCG